MKSPGLLRSRGIALCTAAILILAAPATRADDDDSDEDAIEFDVAEIFFELNDTDGDLGIHSLVDGEPWKELEIEDPRGRDMLDIDVRGRLRRQGLTELFFESAEPPFDELAPEDFFRRFREGEYEIEGETLDGEDVASTTELTHVMPAPPEPAVNTEPYDDDCDDDDFFETSPPIQITWPAVDSCHPDLGTPCDPGDLTVHNYEVVLETDILVDGEEFTIKSSVILPPEITSWTFPAGPIFDLSDEWKYEVLVREESYNQTAIESCFVIN